jgi:hypothetical protein
MAKAAVGGEDLLSALDGGWIGHGAINKEIALSRGGRRRGRLGGKQSCRHQA